MFGKMQKACEKSFSLFLPPHILRENICKWAKKIQLYIYLSNWYNNFECFTNSQYIEKIRVDKILNDPTEPTKMVRFISLIIA